NTRGGSERGGERLEDPAGATLLKHLRLNNNRLCALPRDLAACGGSLQYLNISNNLFRTFPQPVLQLAHLQELHVQNNALRQLPRELFQGQSLKMFKASGNPLREPPSEVCAGGIRQIRNYFNHLQHGLAQEDKRVKTMFLGASLAGKSTICRSLKQGQSKLVPKEDRTVGIEISEFQIEDFTFLFWDFAGQLEYYMTHHPEQRAPPGHLAVPPPPLGKHRLPPACIFNNDVQGECGDQDYLCRAQVLQLCWASLTATSSLLLFPCSSWCGTT
uniref:Malignant fibrous histiocytoma-amplified sequence 1-like n=1 Tax=Serinus canaria TaxID=9135 RepID=A0A8C9NKJ0_SERCA